MSNTKVILQEVEEQFNYNQFAMAILGDKPKQLFCPTWTPNKPLYVITNIEDENVTYYCNGDADKTPKKVTIRDFYNKVSFGESLSNYYY